MTCEKAESHRGAYDRPMNQAPITLNLAEDARANCPGTCCVCGRAFDASDIGSTIVRLDLAAAILAFHRDPCAAVLLDRLKPFIPRA